MREVIQIALSVDAVGRTPTGIGRYAWELAQGLEASPQVEPSFFRNRRWYDGLRQARDDAGISRRGWRSRISDKIQSLRNRSTLVHAPNYFLPQWARRGVATIHDLSVLKFPDTHPLQRVRDFERHFASTVRRADHIITDCMTVRDELIHELGVGADRVSVVPLGIDAVSTRHIGYLPSAANPMLPPPGYTLCVATLEPRKRVDRLIDAYGLLPGEFRRQHPLVLIGHRGWKSEGLVEKIDRASRAGWLRWLDYVGDATLDQAYRQAGLFVFPSMYEGFGLPPLEAMARGIPTLIGDADSVIEVTKGAAKVVDVEDHLAFARSIEEAMDDDGWRRSAAVEGKAVASGYQWSDCVERTIDVYRKIVEA